MNFTLTPDVVDSSLTCAGRNARVPSADVNSSLTCAGRNAWIQTIDIEGDVDRSVSHLAPNLFHQRLQGLSVDVLRSYDVEALHEAVPRK